MSNSPLGMTWDEYLGTRPESDEGSEQPQYCWRDRVQSLCEMTTGVSR